MSTPLHMAVAWAQRGAHGRAEVLERRLKVASEPLRLGADPNVVASDGDLLEGGDFRYASS